MGRGIWAGDRQPEVCTEGSPLCWGRATGEGMEAQWGQVCPPTAQQDGKLSLLYFISFVFPA